MIGAKTHERSTEPDAMERYEQAAEEHWRFLRSAAAILLVAFGVAVWGVLDWLHRVGKL